MEIGNVPKVCHHISNPIGASKHSRTYRGVNQLAISRLELRSREKPNHLSATIKKYLNSNVLQASKQFDKRVSRTEVLQIGSCAEADAAAM